MLEQALVDATALREAALKNAETAILERYADDVRTTMDSLLAEQEDMGDMGIGMEVEDTEDPEEKIPDAATSDLRACPSDDKIMTFTFNIKTCVILLLS